MQGRDGGPGSGKRRYLRLRRFEGNGGSDRCRIGIGLISKLSEVGIVVTSSQYLSELFSYRG